jgi:hypothetical protein
MLALAEVADVLGLPPRETAARSPFGLMARIENGLPIGALERVALLLAPDDARFKYRLVPKATYDRRKKGALRLSTVSKRFGEAWCRERRSLVLLVPSVVARLDRNVLINPTHPEFSRLETSLHEPVYWDRRLFGA